MKEKEGHRHRPVLLEEAMEAMQIQPRGCYIDATFGRGGHSAALLERLGPQGRLLALDQDPEAIAHGRVRFSGEPRLTLVQENFARLDQVARDWRGQVQGILFDLGVSSPQLDDPVRGFSFQHDGPLDMRMNPGQGESAAQWLARASEEEIARVLWEYGEERHARRIARAIVRRRARAPLRTTAQLAELVQSAQPRRDRHKHPATRTFQAIRLQVNRELPALQKALEQAVPLLAPGGRLVVIAFHSLEDRIVKRFLRQRSRGPRLPRGLPVTADAEPRGELRRLGKAVRPSPREVQENPRARSAVLRVAEKRG